MPRFDPIDIQCHACGYVIRGYEVRYRPMIGRNRAGEAVQLVVCADCVAGGIDDETLDLSAELVRPSTTEEVTDAPIQSASVAAQPDQQPPLPFAPARGG